MTTAELRRAEATYQAALRRYEDARDRRTAAVRKALAGGMTHAQVAQELGVSRGRIGQIAGKMEEVRQ